MDKFEQKEMMKKRPLTKKTWYNWLINYISNPKDKFMSLFKRNTTKNYSKTSTYQNVYSSGKKLRNKSKKQSEDKIIGKTRNIFRQKKENEAIKDRIIGDIKNLSEQEQEDYYKPVRVGDRLRVGRLY